MRTSFRVLTAVAAALAAAQPALAAPSAHAYVRSDRSFQAETGYYGYDRISVSFKHTRGSVGGGTSAGGAGGESWEACVSAWGRTVSFYGCGAPTAVTVDIPPAAATGKVKFTLRDSWGGGTAVADLTLTDAGATPQAGYQLYPYGTAVSPGVTTTRLATLKGTIRVTSRRGSRPVTKTFSISDTPVRLVDAVSGSAYVHPGI